MHPDAAISGACCIFFEANDEKMFITIEKD